jgi:hypothetical protein
MRVECYFDEENGIRLRDDSGKVLVLANECRGVSVVPQDSNFPLPKPKPDCYVEVNQDLYNTFYHKLFDYSIRQIDDDSFSQTSEAKQLDAEIGALERQFLLELREEFKDKARKELSDVCTPAPDRNNPSNTSG